MRITKQSGDTPPPIESFTNSFDEPAPPGMFWITLIWRSYDGEERKKPLFLERLDDTNRIVRVTLSPNGRYHYEAGVQKSYLCKVGQPKKQEVFDGLHYCLFSPNSCLLCGYSQGDGAFRRVECATGRVRTLLTQRHPVSSESHYSYLFGWYPDSTHIWYCEDFPRADGSATPKHFYKLNVLTLRRQRLSEAERKRLFEDWTLLDPRYRYGWVGMDGKRIFAYSLNQRWRVRVEPFDFYATLDPIGRQAEPSNMYLEGRGGTVRLLLSRKDHSYLEIVPLDVTDDGRWALFAGARWEPYKYMDSDKRYFSEIVAVDTRTLRRYMYFDTRAEGQLNTTVEAFTYGGWAQFWFSRVWDMVPSAR